MQDLSLENAPFPIGNSSSDSREIPSGFQARELQLAVVGN